MPRNDLYHHPYKVQYVGLPTYDEIRKYDSLVIKSYIVFLREKLGVLTDEQTATALSVAKHKAYGILYTLELCSVRQTNPKVLDPKTVRQRLQRFEKKHLKGFEGEVTIRLCDAVMKASSMEPKTDDVVSKVIGQMIEEEVERLTKKPVAIPTSIADTAPIVATEAPEEQEGVEIESAKPPRYNYEQFLQLPEEEQAHYVLDVCNYYHITYGMIARLQFGKTAGDALISRLYGLLTKYGLRDKYVALNPGKKRRPTEPERNSYIVWLGVVKGNGERPDVAVHRVGRGILTPMPTETETPTAITPAETAETTTREETEMPAEKTTPIAEETLPTVQEPPELPVEKPEMLKKERIKAFVQEMSGEKSDAYCLFWFDKDTPILEQAKIFASVMEQYPGKLHGVANFLL